MDDPFVEAMMTMISGLTPLVEGVSGYKSKLEAAGFDSHTAQHMAADLHSEILKNMFAANDGRRR